VRIINGTTTIVTWLNFQHIATILYIVT